MEAKHTKNVQSHSSSAKCKIKPQCDSATYRAWRLNIKKTVKWYWEIRVKGTVTHARGVKIVPSPRESTGGSQKAKNLPYDPAILLKCISSIPEKKIYIYMVHKLNCARMFTAALFPTANTCKRPRRWRRESIPHARWSCTWNVAHRWQATSYRLGQNRGAGEEAFHQEHAPWSQSFCRRRPGDGQARSRGCPTRWLYSLSPPELGSREPRHSSKPRDCVPKTCAYHCMWNLAQNLKHAIDKH